VNRIQCAYVFSVPHSSLLLTACSLGDPFDEGREALDVEVVAIECLALLMPVQHHQVLNATCLLYG
jgi:hypothetical protein